MALTTATIAVLAKPVADLLKPVIDKLTSKINEELKLTYHHIFNSYGKYLENEYERHSRFTSIVFKNEQKRLDDYYIPLTLVKHTSGSDKTVEEKINSYPLKTVNKLNKLLIVDTAGMGKSTLLKYLFINCVKQKSGMPVFIELRKLSREKLLLDFIIEQLAEIDGSSERSLIINLLESGEFVFFFDGYDEIADSERPEVTANLQTFITKAPKNKYFITSRDEKGLIAFADFQRFTIKPLLREEAFCLLRKYAENNLAEKLVSKLEQPEYKNIEEFLVNPLLTSLLYKSFEYKAIIPLKRHIFYRQVFEALYESHDLTKEGGEFQRNKRSKLDIDAFEQVLRYLGYLSYREQKVEYTKDELLKFVDKAKQLAALPTAISSDIIHDLTHAVPLMIHEGNYIRWAHRSIQEYFSALCICRNMQGKQLEILLKYYKEVNFDSHINLVSLCADIESSYFRQSILKDILENLLKEFNSIYTNMPNKINRELIIKRKKLLVGNKLYLINAKSKELSEKLCDNLFRDLGGNNKFNFGGYHRHLDGNSQIFVFNTLISNSINVLHSQSIELFFIKKIKYSEGLDIIFNTYNGIDGVYEIDENQSTIVNQAEYFENINKLIECSIEWQFDEIAAQKLLEEINNEIDVQQEFLEL
ncbi:NACHT domain-containing protein [Methylobacter tundripaludum]|uniref:Putative signal transduction protein with Nacht domain n=1 Tax=Methylobacter tundripaludum (strain ATCC BAA-1195 / DSM 17260 / SV96) TaxID=697282 RepID=G3IYK5_METTV|nr:NACHT domain-containing protein [Methylobacter tundripaludum]EGW20053.1 putative signal transduction protein with Nacht domain [Methylobacter tundripaludum SV96]